MSWVDNISNRMCEYTRVGVYRLTFSEVWCNNIDFDVCSYQTHASRFIAVDPTQPGTQVAITKMGICSGALPGCLDTRKELVSWDVVIEQEGGRQV